MTATTEAGIRRGDLVVVTARTTPPYLLCWLASSAIGAVTVPTNPAATEYNPQRRSDDATRPAPRRTSLAAG